MFVVFLSRAAGDEDVIEVDRHYIKTTTYFVHKTLELLSSILKVVVHT